MKTLALCTSALAFGAAATSVLADLHSFPSASSTVVGSTGFIDGDEIGFFWSVTRGDSVEENLADSYPDVTRAILNVDVPSNALNSGAFVDWEVILNGTTIDTFRVNEGFFGTVSRDVTFASIPAISGAYDVKLRVLNDVPSGQGSHTFAYAGDYNHSIELLPAPGSLALLGLGGLAAARRRRA